jgi:hypothetical protein
MRVCETRRPRRAGSVSCGGVACRRGTSGVRRFARGAAGSLRAHRRRVASLTGLPLRPVPGSHTVVPPSPVPSGRGGCVRRESGSRATRGRLAPRRRRNALEASCGLDRLDFGRSGDLRRGWRRFGRPVRLALVAHSLVGASHEVARYTLQALSVVPDRHEGTEDDPEDRCTAHQSTSTAVTRDERPSRAQARVRDYAPIVPTGRANPSGQRSPGGGRPERRPRWAESRGAGPKRSRHPPRARALTR